MSNLFPIKALFHFEKGQLQSSKNTAGEYTFITASSEWKTHESFTHDCEALIFAMAASGSLGRTHYFNGKFIASDLCFILTPKEKYKDQIDLKFYYTIFNDLREEIVKQTATGTSKISINRENFGNYEIPFFDKDHQEQVRTKLDAVHPIKDGLSLELQTQSDLITKLRASILSDAVSGRLVPQDPNDEPASILLEKIRAEKERLIKEGKIKREKLLPPIAEDEIPYELPDGWVWCRLGDIITNMDSGWSPACLEQPSDNDTWGVLKTTAVQDLCYLAHENKTLPSSLQPRAEYEVQVGDILITRAGPKNRVGICCLVKSTPPKLMISDKIIRFHAYAQIIPAFLELALNCGASNEFIESKKSGMAESQVNISQGNLKLTPVPIAPINEQHRIVANIEQLMATCDALEAEVAKSRTETDRLMQTILKEAFTEQPQKQSESNAPKAFQRSVLAAYLIDNSRDDQYFGHVKLQKMLFMCEAVNNLDFDTDYRRHAMGPYDPKLIRSVDAQLKKSKWFEVKKIEGEISRYVYHPLEKVEEYKKYIGRYWEQNKIEYIYNLMRPMTTLQAEIVATLYSANTDLKKVNEAVSDEVLINEARNNWHDNKKNIPIEKWQTAIKWLKTKGLL